MKIGVKDVSYCIEGKKILDGVSLEVQPLSFVGIIGPNGSGKSTLLKSVYKFIKYQSGEININGNNLKSMNNRTFARQVAVVAQENSCNFSFTVKEIVMMGIYPSKKLFENINADDVKSFEKALECVGLKGFANREYAGLSGGEKQRVLIARALVQNTDILILDEPTNHLDIGAQIKTLDLIKGINKTVLTALHDLNLAAKYCDIVYVMEKGRIIGKGRPCDVITSELVHRLYGVDSEIRKSGNRISIDFNV